MLNRMNENEKEWAMGVKYQLAQAMSDDLGCQKQEAFERLSEAWHEAIGDGIEPDVMAHVALFAALSDLVDTYGEPAVAEFADRLASRIQGGEFTIPAIVN
jgi:rhamnogalacturonyl hydrolase YesR